MGAAVVALVALLEVVPLLVADEHHAEVAQPREPGTQSAVVAKGTVAVQFHEVVEDELDVVQELRPLGMAGHFDALPRR